MRGENILEEIGAVGFCGSDVGSGGGGGGGQGVGGGLAMTSGSRGYRGLVEEMGDKWPFEGKKVRAFS